MVIDFFFFFVTYKCTSYPHIETNLNKTTKKACLTENQCPQIRKWVGIYETLKKWKYCPVGCYTGASVLVQVAWNE